MALEPRKKGVVTYATLLNVIFILSATGCTIENISDVSQSPFNVSLNWVVSPSCPKNVGPFKISYRQIAYLACQKNVTRPKTFIETDKTFILLDNLKPYSRYEFYISSKNDEFIHKKYIFDTSESAPDYRPEKMKKSSSVFVQAIKFYWSVSNRENCELQNGKQNGFRIELSGMDPWVDQPRPLFDGFVRNSMDVPQYYAQHLLPYSTYKLKIFSVNSMDLYNPDMPLELVATTLPTVPKPPNDLRVTLATSESAHLNWKPTYPPTGDVELYVVRAGILPHNESSVVWKKRLEILPNSSYCQTAPDDLDSAQTFCYHIQNLTSSTKYHFQIQVFNRNVPEPSEFSPSVIITTDAIPSPVTNLGNLEKVNSNSGRESNTHLVIIIILAVLTLIIITIVTLYYRNKVYKLELTAYKESDRPYSVSQISVGRVRFSRNRDCVSIGQATTASQYVTQQIEEIQRRRLPEPPPAEVSTLVGDRQKQHTKGYNFIADSNLTEECTDIEGYLKPTFHWKPKSKEEICRPVTTSPISMESYKSPKEISNSTSELENRASMYSSTSYDPFSRQTSTASESLPLISPTTLQ